MSEEAETLPPALAKIKAYKAANEGTETLTLPATGIACSFPRYRNHGLIMKAAKIAKGDAQRMQLVYIQQNVLFDGVRLTVADIEELPDDDSTVLIQRLFGATGDYGEDGEDGAGN